MLNRSQAIIVLQDILFNFTGNSIDSFGLCKSNENDHCAVGYQLYIKGVFTDACKRKIQEIADDYNLNVKEEKGLVIYSATD